MKRRLILWLIMAVLSLGGAASLQSCGHMRSYWGVEGNYDFDDHDHGRHKGKYKKHHKKHNKHHHHHDDDDDD